MPKKGPNPLAGSVLLNYDKDPISLNKSTSCLISLSNEIKTLFELRLPRCEIINALRKIYEFLMLHPRDSNLPLPQYLFKYIIPKSWESSII